MNTYEEKLAARKVRYEERAERAQAESQQRSDTARQIMSFIPPGQPILIGHHSEKRHRRDLAKIDTNIRKSVEAGQKAQHYERRAASVGKAGISSDDPEAVTKLKAKLAQLEANQTAMRDANKLVRRHKTGKLPTEELTEALAKVFPGWDSSKTVKLLTPDFCGRVGFASYMLTNNNGNMKRIKDRIADLERSAAMEPAEDIEVEGCRVVENTDENRIQLFFDGKPPAHVRAQLKARGFRWSRYNVAWQRHLNNSGRWSAQEILRFLETQ